MPLVLAGALLLGGCAGDEPAATRAGPTQGSGVPVSTGTGTEASRTPAAASPSTAPAPRVDQPDGPAADGPTTTPPTAVGPSDGSLPLLPAEPVGATVEVGGGFVAEVVDVRPTRIEAGVPGDIAGPAVAVVVAISNDGTADIDVDRVTVSAAYGDSREASGYEGGVASPHRGVLAPGETSEGTYVFAVPEDQVDTLVVRVGPEPGRSVAVFSASPSG